VWRICKHLIKYKIIITLNIRIIKIIVKVLVRIKYLINKIGKWIFKELGKESRKGKDKKKGKNRYNWNMKGHKKDLDKNKIKGWCK